MISQRLTKWSEIEAYNSIYKYDMICISEIYFDFSIPAEDKIIQLDGYNSVRADHPCNTKGAVFVSIASNI